MTAICIIAFLVVGFYFKFYRNWQYKGKFTFKAIMIYIGLMLFVGNVILLINSVGQAAEDKKDDMLESRLERIRDREAQGDLYWLAQSLDLYSDYEWEFEYAWERVCMNESYTRYMIFKEAADAGMGEEYEQMQNKYKKKLTDLCENVKYEENIPYATNFMEQSGLDDNQ